MKTKPDITIRPMRSEDLDQAMAILEYWNMAPRPPTEEVPDPERSGLKVANSFVAESGGKVVGVCSYIVHGPKLVETASMAVLPEFKGRGLGRLLQEARMREFRRRGISTVRTETDRRSVIRWLVRDYGFRIVGKNPKKHDFGQENIDHWTVLELKLENR